jgi:hypothetical protein
VAQLIDITHLLPVRIRDVRITALEKAFGRGAFSSFDAAAILDLPEPEVWRILFINDLADDCARVTRDNGKFTILPIPQEIPALESWRRRYLPVLRTLPQPFSASQFAIAASIPFPSANYLLGLFYAHRLIIQTMTPIIGSGNGYGDSTQIFRVRRRRVVLPPGYRRPRYSEA